jgi:hypothetical protein
VRLEANCTFRGKVNGAIDAAHGEDSTRSVQRRVLAIIITIMVLELRVPHETSCTTDANSQSRFHSSNV